MNNLFTWNCVSVEINFQRAEKLRSWQSREWGSSLLILSKVMERPCLSFLTGLASYSLPSSRILLIYLLIYYFSSFVPISQTAASDVSSPSYMIIPFFWCCIFPFPSRLVSFVLFFLSFIFFLLVILRFNLKRFLLKIRRGKVWNGKKKRKEEFLVFIGEFHLLMRWDFPAFIFFQF